MRAFKTIAELERGIAVVARSEPRFGAIAAQGRPALRRRPQGFDTLAQIIIQQMISLRAADVIARRIRQAFDPFTAAVVARYRVERLTALGLSRGKARAIMALAQAVATGTLRLDRLARLNDEEARRQLMALAGVGPWTAEIYLLTALQRCDAWPAGDMALQKAAQALFGLAERPSPRRLIAMAEPWRPWRSVAARLLWAHYRRIHGMTAAAHEGARPLHRPVTQDIVGTSGTKLTSEV